MNTLSQRQRNLLDSLRRAINDAISGSDAVAQAIAALVEAGVTTPVSIDVSLLDDPDKGPGRTRARRITNRPPGFTKFDRAFLGGLGIVLDDLSGPDLTLGS